MFNPYSSLDGPFTFDPATGMLKYRGNGSYSTGLLSGGSTIPEPGTGSTSAGGGSTGAGSSGTGSSPNNPAGIDWAALISGDPAYQQTLADLQAATVSDQASRDAAIRHAIINFGQVPDLQAAQNALGFDVGPIVDAQTAQLAGQNQYSTEANLQHGYQQGIQRLRAALAARGALQSGEFGYQLGEAQRGYGNAENSALQNLLDALGGYQSQYVNAVNGRQLTGTQALADALSRVLAQYGNSVGGPSNTPAAPTGTDTTSPGAVPTRQPIVGTAVGLPAPNAAALQGGRLARADYTM